MKENGLIESERCYTVFRETDPEWFLASSSDTWACPDAVSSDEEREEMEALKADTWLHSALTVVSIMTLVDSIKPDGGPVRVLDLGCGNGYMTAILAQIAQPDGTVVSVDTDAKKVQAARISLSRRFPEIMPHVELRCGDAFKKQGESESFDIVHVGGAVDQVPKVWVEQLKIGGTIIAAFPNLHRRDGEEPAVGHILRRVIRKTAEDLSSIDMMVVNYEKLVSPSPSRDG